MFITYEKLRKKYAISSKSRETTIKKKFAEACFELYRVDRSLLHSRIIDDFFENGERVANITKKTIREYAQKSDSFNDIVQNYFKELM